MFFNSIPRWESLSNCQKFLLTTGDIMYSCITMGIPIAASVWTGSAIPFFGIAAVEAVCGVIPTPPGCLTAISIFKSTPQHVLSGEAQEDLSNEQDLEVAGKENYVLLDPVSELISTDQPRHESSVTKSMS